MAEVASAFVTLMPSAKGFGRATEKELGSELPGVGRRQGEKLGDETTKGFGAKIKGIGGLVAGAFAAAGAVSFATGAIAEASDLGETISKVGVVFGKGAAQVEAYASTASKSIGQSKLAALNAASTFGVFGKMAGLSGQKLAAFSTDFTGLASDLASFHNASPEEAVEAIGAALRGEAEPIRRFGVLLDDATLRNEALKLGLIKTTKDALTPQQKVLAAQAAIMSQTKDAQGDFARTSDSLANKQRTLSAEFDNLKGRVGQAFLPAASAVVGAGLAMITNIDKVGQAFSTAKGFVEDNGVAFGVVSGIIAVLFIPHLVALALQSARTATANALAWGKTQASAVKAAAIHSLQIGKMIAGWVLLAVRSVAQAVIAATAWTVGIIAPAAKAVLSFGLTVIRVVAGWTLMAVQSLIQAGRMAASWLIAMGPIGWVIAAVVGLALLIWQNWDKIKQFTGEAWSWVSEKIAAAWGWIKEKVSALGGALVDFVKSIPQRMVSFFMNWSLPGLIIKHWDSIKAGAIGKAMDLVNWVRGLPGRITGALGNLGSLLVDKGKDLVRGLWDGIKDMGDWLRDKLIGFVKDKIPGPVAKALGIQSPSKVMRDLARWIPVGMALGIEDGTKDVTGAASAMASAAVPTLDAPSLTSQLRAPSVGSLDPLATAGGGGRPVQIDVHDESRDPQITARETARILAFEGA